VLDEIERSNADTLIGPGPIGITRHADHIAAHHAMMEAVSRSDRALQVFYLAVPPVFADELNVEGVEREPTHEVDVTEFFETKLAALACHSSQQDAREFFLMLANLQLKTELFHRAVPAHDGGEIRAGLFD
jgi:LmbE family N-acetylglucosaminyl deacetylase